VALPILLVFSAVLDAAAAAEGVLADPLVLPPDELPQAAAIRAMPASPADACHLIPITFTACSRMI
jgi:hypothetical protein